MISSLTNRKLLITGVQYAAGPQKFMKSMKVGLMKVIREGFIPNVSVIFICEICGTIYEMTYKELLETYGDITLSECPNCFYINGAHVMQKVPGSEDIGELSFQEEEED